MQSFLFVPKFRLSTQNYHYGNNDNHSARRVGCVSSYVASLNTRSNIGQRRVPILRRV